jgi:hypothetical protein
MNPGEAVRFLKRPRNIYELSCAVNRLVWFIPDALEIPCAKNVPFTALHDDTID